MKEQGKEMSFTGVEIAVIGMSGRFPGAKNIDRFWENLIAGRETITFYSDEELKKERLHTGLINNPRYVKAYGWLEDIEFFDAAFFGYTPLEAEIMDPQTRLFHECAVEALENAGYDSFTYKKLIGLYAGAAPSFDWQALVELSGKNEILGWFASRNYNDKDFLATHLAHKLNLRGPAVTLDTACSTSLVAVHLASQGLLSGDCDMAIAGAATVQTLIKAGYLYQEGMIQSTDGHCRSFDAKANGSNFGNGVGVVVLKRLEDATADGDTIHALIKGSFINNDGVRKAAYTAPSAEGQAEVIRNAYNMAGVDPETIGYVEAHGTATSLGDPVEIEGLKAAFNTAKKQFCRIGSVKSNVGHLQNSSGITGFIKTVLVLKHHRIPPSLFYEKSNPGIDFKNTPFEVNTGLYEWKRGDYPRRAGVSSFGIGGTNAHVVLEEAPVNGQSSSVDGEKRKEREREYQLILLSAKTETALAKMTENLANHLRQHPGIDLADAAYTLQVGRRVYTHRRMLLCTGTAEAAAALSEPEAGQMETYCVKEDNPYLVFMFPGIGSQYTEMGRELYRREPVFREEMDRCFEILKPLMGQDIKEVLYPGDRSNGSNRSYSSDPSYRSDLNRTEVAQLAIFIVEYALARMLMKWGIKPDAMIGYSFGEYAAACISGVFTLEEALKLLVARGKLIGTLPPGVMLSVPLTREELIPILGTRGQLSIAIDNGPSCLVAGAPGEVGDFEEQMKKRKLMCMRITASHALHTPMMDPVIKEFEAAVGTLRLNKPHIPYISNVTGDWIKDHEAVEPAYWARHMRNTVRYADGMKVLVKRPGAIFLEIGPGRDLANLAHRHLENQGSDKNNRGAGRVLNLMRHPGQEEAEVYFLMNRLGKLWLRGRSVDWQSFHAGETRHRVALPAYPFEGQRYWVETNKEKRKILFAPQQKHQERKPQIADWFYIPQWTRSVLKQDPNQGEREPSTWIFFTKQHPLADQLENQIKEEGEVIIRVLAEPALRVGEGGGREFAVDPRSPDHYRELLEQLSRGGGLRGTIKIVHLWNIDGNDPGPAAREWSEDSQYLGIYSLIYLARAIGRNRLGNEIQLNVITDHLQEVTGEEVLSPAKATLLGALKVIPQEYPNVRCRSIDIQVPEPGGRPGTELVIRLSRELWGAPTDPVVAYRHNYRWLQTFVPYPLEDPGTRIPRLRKQGVYLITGGLGNIGHSLSKYLIRQWGAKLILTGRTALPPREEWETWLETHHADDRVSRGIRQMKALRDMGGEVLFFSGDSADRQQMQRILDRAREALGPINGVIHAAGDTGTIVTPLENLDEAACRRQFTPKIQGLQVLGALSRDEKLDFVLAISSLSPILGGLGFTAYSAANTYMDAYAYYRSRGSSTRWLSVNWGDWKSEKPSVLSGTTLADLEMTPGEGIKTFQRVLVYEGTPQIIISAGDLQTRIDRWVKFVPGEDGAGETQGQETATHNKRPDLITPYKAPRGQLEQEIAESWKSLFGYDRVGVQDDFFELGGDSLKAITSISKMHQNAHILLSLVEFFNLRTIEKIVQYIIKNAKKEDYYSIRQVEEKEYYVLSSAQKRLYFLQQMEKTGVAYNEFKVVTREVPVDRENIQRIFRELIGRHESLRTSFITVEGRPVQKVHKNVEFAIEYHELSGAGGGEKGGGEEKTADPGTRAVTGIIRGFIRPFELAVAPLLRVGVIEAGPGKHILMVDLHHIITDGTSNQILLNEFSELNQGRSLPAMPTRYIDYAEMQYQGEHQDRRHKQQTYWLKEMAGHIPVLALPTDYPRPARKSFQGKAVDIRLGREETRSLKNLQPEQEATLYMKLLAIFNVFLFKISGQEDIVVGTPTAGRRHAELENIIGMFVNTLPIRNYPQADKTFDRFLKEVKEKTLSDFENQEYPFEDLIDRLNVGRDLGRNPLFDVVFVLQNQGTANPGRTGEGEMHRTPVPYNYQDNISKFDLALQGYEGPETVGFKLEYCEKLFSRETIGRFVGYIQRVVTAVLERPGQRLWEIGIMTEAERKQLLEEYNGADTEYPQDKTIHSLAAEQAAAVPDSIAVNAPRFLFITYKELGERSARLAAVLKEKGLRPGTTAAVLMDRSIEIIISMLAVMEAGGAYLPIDPGYPGERIKYMLNDSGAGILLTGDNIEGNIESIKNRPYMSYKSYKIEKMSATSLAYIIYTSGTTGRPKGVMVRHRGFVNLIYCQRRVFGQERGTRMSQVANPGFDAMAAEVWPALAWGAALYIVPAEIRQDPVRMKAWLIKHRVQISYQATLMAEQLITRDWTDPGIGLKVLYTAGDRLKQHPTRPHPFRFYNLYGPTEDTVWTTWAAVPVQAGDDNHRYPLIGKPIGNHRVYILGTHGEMQPVGVPGEICIAGEGIALGYLNNPELTVEKFCLLINRSFWKSRNLFSKRFLAAGGTIYKTGDLARWQSDGSIDFIGRRDSQVKIRGFRIEMGEIENRIAKHEGIEEVVVIDRERGGGDRYLCAYFTAGREQSAAGIKAYLAGQLPDYMIPAYIMQVEKIPLTVNGKVDRRALPVPGIEPGEDYVKPDTEMEKRIAGIWAEVLEIDRIGVHSRFFDIGGNSFNILQVQTRIREVVGEEVPLMVLFQYPTVQTLAGYIGRAGSAGEERRQAQQEERLEADKIMMKQTFQKLGANV